MDLVSHISKSIQRIDSGSNFTIYYAEWLNICNMKAAYQSTIEVDYIEEIPQHNDRCTSHDSM